MKQSDTLFWSTISVVLLGWAAGLWAQPSHVGVRPPAANVIVPQSRSFGWAPGGQPAIRIAGVEALVDILETTATTTIEIRLENTSGQRQEAELVVPVPDGAVVRGFAYDGPSGQVEARVMAREEARRIYRDLVSRIRDPALVEFAGYNLIRSSVFPVEPHGKQRLRLTYENLLQAEGSRIDYVLPRSESLQYDVPWRMTVNIRAKAPISTVYCPSHTVFTHRDSDRTLSVKVDLEAGKQPGPFRLSYLVESETGEVTASVLAFPDAEVGGGYFLLLAGSPRPQASDSRRDITAIRREVTIVLDRSGSMRDQKLAQAKEAALQVIAGLKEGEAFNLVVYSNSVELFSPRPVRKDAESLGAARRYIEGITAMGGTNLHDALKTALDQAPTEGMIPIVLFLTDGLPTVGQTSEAAIRDLATRFNPHGRRIFTFGVGLDVNAPLLEKLADLSRAKAEFVLPDEDVEVKVGRVFARLAGPVLAEPKLQVLTQDGTPALGRVRDLLPALLPDLFDGDQLVLLGQYVGQETVTLELTGRGPGGPHTSRFSLDPAKADRLHGFVARLWASRKIAEMIDLVRQMGADGARAADDPKVKELTEEIVRLSTRFGILTEYTAFLAREGTDLQDPVRVTREAARNFDLRAMRVRSGLGAINQSMNLQNQKGQTVLNYDNAFLNEHMEPVRITTVQQTHDRAFYNKANRWIDSRLTSAQAEVKPDRTVEFGTEAFWDLVGRLAREGRQGSLAFSADVLLSVDGQTVLVHMPQDVQHSGK
jgi:Ca-activated chloride channel homolog